MGRSSLENLRFPLAPLLGATLVLASALFASSARAEYRVFELAITNTQTGQARTVTSTLDDIQYRAYYPMKSTEAIVIQATWMCWQPGGEGVRYCPNPRPQQQGAQPAPGVPDRSSSQSATAPSASSTGGRAPASSPR